MARLHIQIEDGSFVVRELNWGVTRIGRSSENDITIAHPSLSQRHCELELGPGFLKVRDLGSTNGTFISDRPVTEANLAPGDRLRLGHVLTTVEWSQENVVVPDIEVPKLPSSMDLGDGVLSCIRHSATVASWHCAACDKYFCSGCIKDVRLVARPPRRICPECSQPVALAPWADGNRRKESLWKRIKSTLKRAAGGS